MVYHVKGFAISYYNINDSQWVLIHLMLGIVKIITIPVTGVRKKCLILNQFWLQNELFVKTLLGKNYCYL